MALKRVRFEGDVFPRREETDAEWLDLVHRGEDPIARGVMEIFGEVQPLAVSGYSEHGNSLLDSLVVHEYVWNVGLQGSTMDWVERLDDDDAVLVQIMIQTGRSPYTAREVFATLEYLPPTRNIPQSPSFLQWTKNVIGGAGKVAEGAGLSVYGALGSAIADIIPPDDPETRWFLNRFTLLSGDRPENACYAVEWHLSRKLIHQTGSRFVGRLGIAFFEAPLQGEEGRSAGDDLLLVGRFGLKLAKSAGRWYDFSLLPRSDLASLALRVAPRSKEEAR